MLPIYRPTELRLFLQELGIFPKKGLSQNFLIDGNIIRKIVAAAHVQPDDVILEVGPGPGSLTQALLETGATVVAVEKDNTLAHALERLQTSSHQLTIFCEDIMTFDSVKDFAPRLIDGKKAKVIANLPYHLTTPIIAQFALQSHTFSSLTVMVQEEVARRMTAQAGSADYSSFSIFLQFYSEPHYDFGVSRNCFYPIPKVDSAVVTLTLRNPPLEEKEAEQFFKITRSAFEHRRKMLRASLKHLFLPQKIEEALESIGQNPLARPEMLSLDEFLQLYRILT
jgi:16S rRNA (adenine1518-N6/adenine1519-N6)-dimethyltransferase